ncbi:hypothetical protein CCO03_02865 [Comamonas serinivorans]|uniref:DUF2170 domain-containing protein n=1 Tax=Comamonas serinivorans TaxID=1082851 RepID=A0A1Y0EJF8_9BURK|nr:DUF2170 family protein [Comamonas serinivorans]ARU03765.1 hypothetical protein CCO03_02865 [Comamonas serinivorans]
MTELHQQLGNLDVLTSAVMGGVAVQLQPISGEVPVIQVSIEGRDELPIFVTSSGTQLICLCYLWTEDEVKPDQRVQLHEALLDLNPAVPLSSFGRVGNRYVLTGALARTARAEDVAHEVAVLSDNALDALDALKDFLR